MSTMNTLQVFAVLALSFSQVRAAVCDDMYIERHDNVIELSHDLVMRSEYGGIAGKTGKILTISKDGAWTFERFRDTRKNDKSVRSVVEKGKLTSAEIVALADGLKKVDFLHLPDSIGAPSKVNPQRFALQFGEHEVIVEGLIMEVDSALGPQFNKIVQASEDEFRAQLGAFADVVNLMESLTAFKKNEVDE